VDPATLAAQREEILAELARPVGTALGDRAGLPGWMLSDQEQSQRFEEEQAYAARQAALEDELKQNDLLIPTPLRRSMLGRLCEEYRDFGSKLAAARAAPRQDAARRLVHTLKGVAGNLRLAELAESDGDVPRKLDPAAAGEALDAHARVIEQGVERLAESLRRLAPATIEPPAPCRDLPRLTPEQADRCRNLAAQLGELLRNGDAEALSVAAALAAAVGDDSDLGRRTAALSRRVQMFELTAAAAALAELAAPLGRLGTGGDATPTVGADLAATLTAVGLDADDATLRQTGEMVIRNYDPCISCATHFLRLTLHR